MIIVSLSIFPGVGAVDALARVITVWLEFLCGPEHRILLQLWCSAIDMSDLFRPFYK